MAAAIALLFFPRGFIDDPDKAYKLEKITDDQLIYWIERHNKHFFKPVTFLRVFSEEEK